MSAAEFAQLVLAIKYGLVALSPPIVWYLLRTRIARTFATIVRVVAWDWLLRRRGVSADTRRKLIVDAANRDLESS